MLRDAATWRGRSSPRASRRLWMLWAPQDQESEHLRTELAALNGKAMEQERDRDDLEAGRLRLRREIAEAERELQRLQSEYARADGV